MKILVAIPTMDGKVCMETAGAMLHEQMLARESGDQIQFLWLAFTSLITQARNKLMAGFLASDCERLFFLDSDVSWETGDLLKVAKSPAYVVGGAYRYKRDPQDYPVGFMADRSRDGNGLILVEYLPFGFVAVAKSVPYRLMEAEDRPYEHMGEKFHAFFTSPYKGGCMFGEDAAFCQDCRTIGIPIYLQPDVTLTHHQGPQKYTGNIGNWLKEQK